jgi:hypothetical protein
VTGEERVEAALRELGGRLAVPEPPADLTTAVLARLDEPAPRPVPRAPSRLLPRLAAAAAALLVALAVAMAVSPTVRAAVLDFLRIGDVEIHYEQSPVSPAPDPVLPGERAVSLAQARAQAPFDVRVPALLGEPESVRLIDGDPPRVVSLHYPGVRVEEFAGTISPIFEKFTRAEDVVLTRVDGFAGVWIPRPHPVIYLGRDGVLREEAARLAGRTLIWEAGGVTYRVEGDLTRELAVTIAESMS